MPGKSEAHRTYRDAAFALPVKVDTVNGKVVLTDRFKHREVLAHGCVVEIFGREHP